MTVDDPSEVIAPRDDLPYETWSYLTEMFVGAYPNGKVVEYHGLKLVSKSDYDRGVFVFEVYTNGDSYIDTLNLGAFRSLTELQKRLDRIVAYDPDGHEDWASR